jgi:DNA invertase Pin-like site-specific DNA recombinase
MTAILYARVSTTDKQDPEMQLAELREYGVLA